MIGFFQILQASHDPWEITLEERKSTACVPEGMKHFSVSLPKVCKMKIVPTNNLPRIASQEIVELKFYPSFK